MIEEWVHSILGFGEGRITESFTEELKLTWTLEIRSAQASNQEGEDQGEG